MESKMRMKFLIGLVLAATLGLAGCANGIGPKQAGGGLIGAVGGGVLGAQIGKSGSTGQLIAVGAGTLLGAFIGSEIGASLDRIDQMHAERSLNTALNTDGGAPVVWSNPDTGHHGSYEVTGVRQGQTGPCKRYTQTIFVDGKSETAVGQACRNADGSWSVQS